MKFVVISDTHGLHHDLELPSADAIIHAGDISDYGKKDEIIDFLNWFADLDYSYKIFIGGNHDFFLQKQPMELLEILPESVKYLNNQALTIHDIKLWGSPVTPDLENWAFGKNRDDMELHWKFIPSDVDVLITHSPPFGILDKSSEHISLGCRNLLKRLGELKPKFHVFGHIHASYGIMVVDETTFINASNLNTYMGLINTPISFELEKQL